MRSFLFVVSSTRADGNTERRARSSGTRTDPGEIENAAAAIAAANSYFT